MALQDNLPRKDQSALSLAVEQADMVFIIFFTFESLIKIIAMGFVLNKGSYLRSFWNILDFVVVISGLVTILFTAVDLSILKTLRILRPLKLLTRVRSLRVILQAIGTAMFPLLQIAFILLFIITIFSIVGMQFYNGVFHWACFDKATGQLITTTEVRPCAVDGSTGYLAHTCGEGATCKRYWKGPNGGITSFDNIGFAMLTVFQCITTEGWTDIMYLADGVYGQGFNWIYFGILVVVGTFFMLNLVLGVLSA